MRQAGIIEEYLVKYREDMKAKEGRALAELVLSSDKQGKKGCKPKSRVSIEHYQTPLNILEHHFLNYIC